MGINKKRVSPTKIVLAPGIQPSRATPDKSKGEHLNFMGGVSFDVNPLTRLQMIASSCFFGEPKYYKGAKTRRSTGGVSQNRLSTSQRTHLNSTLASLDNWDWRALAPDKMLERAIDEALDYDAEAVLRFAAHLRQVQNMRVTPQVIMVRAGHHRKVKGTGLITRYAGAILNRLDEVNTQYAYHLDKYGKRVPKSLKRNWARRLAKANAYELMKYRQEGREVNLFDVINVTHPKSELIDKLMKGTLKWEDKRVTWEVLRSQGKSWTIAAGVMGHMALLRNLRNIHQDKSVTPELLRKLVAGAPKGRQLPFRYLSAYRELEKVGASAAMLDAVEECLELSIGNLPHFKGTTVVLSDNSGSARGQVTSEMGTMKVAEVGNLMAVLTAKASDQGHVGVFGDRLIMHDIRKKSSVFDALKTVSANGSAHKIGHGTENGVWLFFQDAIKNKRHYDNIFVYSDMQAGHGGLFGTTTAHRAYQSAGYSWPNDGYGGRYIDVPALVKAYRAGVNKNVNVFLVQTAGYADVLIPEFYDRTYILGGWSPEVIRFAGYMNEMRPQQ